MRKVNQSSQKNMIQAAGASVDTTMYWNLKHIWTEDVGHWTGYRSLDTSRLTKWTCLKSNIIMVK